MNSSEIKTAKPVVPLNDQKALPETAAKSNKKPSPLIFVGLGGLAVLAIGGFYYVQQAAGYEQTDNAVVAAHIHPVSPRISGVVSQVLIQENQIVKAGQPLVKLDPRDDQMALVQAQAALTTVQSQARTAQTSIALASGNAQAADTQALGGLQSAAAAIASAQSAVRAVQAAVPIAQAQLQQAEANLTKAKLDYTRYQSLRQEGAISQQQLEAAKATYEVNLATRAAARQGIAQAQANLAQAQETVTRTRAGLLQSQGTVQQAKVGQVQTQINRNQYAAALTAVTQAKAALANAQLQLSYTTLRAPVSGRIGKRSVEVGQRVQPGQQLMALVENQVWISANFKETQLARMQPGQSVEIKVDAFGDHPFKGHVDSLAPASGAQFSLLPPDNATGNFTKIVQRIPVKIFLEADSLKGYEQRLVPGMSADVRVQVKN